MLWDAETDHYTSKPEDNLVPLLVIYVTLDAWNTSWTELSHSSIYGSIHSSCHLRMQKSVEISVTGKRRRMW